MKSENQGIIQALLASIFIGFSFVFSSQANKAMNPITFTMLSSLLSSLILFLGMKLLKRNLGIKKLLKENYKEVIQIVLFRAFLGSLILNFGMKFTNATRASFLSRLEPMFVLFLSYFFLKEKVKTRQIFLVLSLIFGGFLISFSGDLSTFTTYNLGDLLVVVSLLFFSYSYFPAQKAMKKTSPQTITIVTNFFAGLTLLSFIFLTHSSTLAINTSALFLLLGYTFTFSILGLSLWYLSLKTVKPWIVSSLLSLTPIFSSILAYFWLKEILTKIQLIGASIILLTSFYLSWSHKKG